MSQAGKMLIRNRLIEDSSTGTMMNCAEVVSFVSLAAAEIERGGGSSCGTAVALVLDCVENALRYEVSRAERARGAAKESASAAEALQ